MYSNYYVIKTLLGPTVAESIEAYGGVNKLLKSGSVEIKKVLKKKNTVEKFMALTHVMDKDYFEPITTIAHSKDAYNYIKEYYTDHDVEYFYMIYLSRSNAPIKAELISKGNQSSTVVCIKQILKKGIMLNAAGMIAVHNHPSGNLQPSDADRNLTFKIKTLAMEMDLPLLDHMIITSDNKWYSFADEGIL